MGALCCCAVLLVCGWTTSHVLLAEMMWSKLYVGFAGTDMVILRRSAKLNCPGREKNYVKTFLVNDNTKIDFLDVTNRRSKKLYYISAENSPFHTRTK